MNANVPILPDASALAESGRLRTGLARFFAAPLAALGAIVLLAVVLVAILAPVLSPQNPYDLMQLDIMDSRLPPGSSSFNGVPYHLGTDGQGRDILSGIMYGLRTSLLVGLVSAVAAALMGTTVGLMAAYVGGRTEGFLMRLVDLQLSFPTILMALMVLAFLGNGVTNVILAIIIAEWATYARTSRGTALVEREKEYIEAARCLRIPAHRILLRHLLPNCLAPIIVIATMQVARAIGLEATLSFLGLGASVTQPSLGMLISNGYQYLLSGLYWISFYPGIALLITIVAINLVGDRLRDVLNPRSTR
ncbi:putative D,D-dipeptide transport system permease protein DdpC [Paracoccus haematequi]|uniref:Putative D,D-dipeptide transport system permease protein DdpC n=1 Tax=Paracoccus haematequi TaxID=2491866 RepID=A0A3S4DDZ6_9RHOB|nr:ABC transporter permease [Paracoccus haematequi]VDS10273.1 putative D,D-dipeptide transport system permease protein DdpC [Paracoccus haematequi]